LSSAPNPLAAPSGDRHQALLKAKDFFEATFDLLSDDITGPIWLGRLASFAECDSVSCMWWPAGQPRECITEHSGEGADLSIDTLHRLDFLIDELDLQQPAVFDESILEAGQLANDPSLSAFPSGTLVACLDYHPARVVLIFKGCKLAATSSQNAALSVEELLPMLQKSVAAKKRLSILSDREDISSKAFDCIPHGVLTLAPDRAMISKNLKAKELLADGSIISMQEGKLVFGDSLLQGEFEEQLALIEDFPVGRLGDYAWYKSVAGKGGLLLTMRALSHDLWRIESSVSNRAAVITLGDAEHSSAPGEAKLRNFYHLTPAQARFANQLLISGGVEAASEVLNISVHTARSHLREIYTKVGVNNMAQLFRQISQTFIVNTNKNID
jgi:DNA-binding CsgD family transcriptional regulator